MRKASSGCVLALCVVCVTGTVVKIHPEKRARIDSFVTGLLNDCEKQRNIVGMNLAVVYRGETLFTTGYGVKNRGIKNFLYTLASVLTCKEHLGIFQRQRKHSATLRSFVHLSKRKMHPFCMRMSPDLLVPLLGALCAMSGFCLSGDTKVVSA